MFQPEQNPAFNRSGVYDWTLDKTIPILDGVEVGFSTLTLD